MKLYIMRHGHAEALPDAQGHRHLSSQGCAELEKLAALLHKHQAHVAQIVHSAKTRARETAEMMARGLSPDHPLEQNDFLNPTADLDELVTHLTQWQDDTLLVGHMPFISELVGQLVTKNPRCDLLRFTPGTLVCLESYDVERWMISWIIRPEMIV